MHRIMYLPINFCAGDFVNSTQSLNISSYNAQHALLGWYRVLILKNESL